MSLARWEIRLGDVRDVLASLPAQSVQCCVTSPPYWGLRDYGTPGQLGLEPTPDAYVAALVDVFRGVWRVLRDDGTLWLNLGDSYASTPPGNATEGVSGKSTLNGVQSDAYRETLAQSVQTKRNTIVGGLKPKDLVGIPWRVAFALQADGWYLRSDIIWHKPNPMPESVTDRPTKAHEYIFLLAKSARYYYDSEAIKEEAGWTRENNPEWQRQRAVTNARKGVGNRNAADGGFTAWSSDQGRNKRSVWTVTTQPYPEAHFATYPEALIEPCILAGTSEKGQCPACGAPWVRVVERSAEYKRANPDVDKGWQPSCACNAGEPVPQTVLDPFTGSGTTGAVAVRRQRSFVGCELNPAYLELARRRIGAVAPLLAREVVA